MIGNEVVTMCKLSGKHWMIINPIGNSLEKVSKDLERLVTCDMLEKHWSGVISCWIR